MYVGTWAARLPEKPALIRAGTGEAYSYRALNEDSIRVARVLQSCGLRRGDRVAIYMENHFAYMAIAWAAFRSGLYLVALNRYFTADDVAYIINDSDAKALFSSAARADTARHLPPRCPSVRHFSMVDGIVPGWTSFEESLADVSPAPLADESMGVVLDYTSGTTGRPKGVLRDLPDLPASAIWPPWQEIAVPYEFDESMVYLATAPLYHGAPMRFVRATHMAGGTVILMEKFDALESLRLIERYRVTHTQWVPTMFVRLQKLSAEDRGRFDLGSHKVAVHAAAPCPIDVKKAMIEWWGPIVHEYFGATDCGGSTAISCAEWLAHPGSVGRARPGGLHVCDEEGNVLPSGQSGLLYFVANPPRPRYLNDPEKTRQSRHPLHEDWITTGDMGYLDEEGYLYLTDRKAFVIISGGVNIYPQQIEDVLVTHPKVGDAAVFGVPNRDMGEEVKAVIEPVSGVETGDDLARELAEFCAARLARYMIPRSFDFVEQLPRSATGKLLKKPLRDRYWQGRTLVS